MLVEAELDKIDVKYDSVEQGEVNTQCDITQLQRSGLSDALKILGFELVDIDKNDLIDKLKNVMLELEQCTDEDLKTSFSDFITMNLNENFISLNTLFAEIEGISIEKYIIKHKIHRVKELLVYNDLNLTEIARKMHYRSLMHLSNQFKSVTGLSPSHFRQLSKRRKFNPCKN